MDPSRRYSASRSLSCSCSFCLESSLSSTSLERSPSSMTPLRVATSALISLDSSVALCSETLAIESSSLAFLKVLYNSLISLANSSFLKFSLSSRLATSRSFSLMSTLRPSTILSYYSAYLSSLLDKDSACCLCSQAVLSTLSSLRRRSSFSSMRRLSLSSNSSNALSWSLSREIRSVSARSLALSSSRRPSVSSLWTCLTNCCSLRAIRSCSTFRCSRRSL